MISALLTLHWTPDVTLPVTPTVRAPLIPSTTLATPAPFTTQVALVPPTIFPVTLVTPALSTLPVTSLQEHKLVHMAWWSKEHGSMEFSGRNGWQTMTRDDALHDHMIKRIVRRLSYLPKCPF